MNVRDKERVIYNDDGTVDRIVHCKMNREHSWWVTVSEGPNDKNPSSLQCMSPYAARIAHSLGLLDRESCVTYIGLYLRFVAWCTNDAGAEAMAERMMKCIDESN